MRGFILVNKLELDCSCPFTIRGEHCLATMQQSRRHKEHDDGILLFQQAMDVPTQKKRHLKNNIF